MSISIQKSFLIPNKSLFLIATPIGNLQEMTPRALDIIISSELIICESLSSCLRILSYFKIKRKKIITYDNIKEKSQFSTSKLINEMIGYNKISLISNAGYPLVSDPGRILVRKWIDLGNYVIPVSGSSAFLNALVASGFYYHNFTFIGFLPRSKNKQKILMQIYANNFISALIIYESANRIENTLMNMREFLGNRFIAICREITKIHEEFIRGNIEEVLKSIKDESFNLKGEIVVIVSVENASNGFEINNSIKRLKK